MATVDRKDVNGFNPEITWGDEGPLNQSAFAAARKQDVIRIDPEITWGDEGPLQSLQLDRGSNRIGLRIRNGAIARADVAASKAAELTGPRIPGRNGNS